VTAGHLTPRTVTSVATLTALLCALGFAGTLGASVAAGRAAQQAEARPEPPAAFTKVCVRCHPSDKIVEGRRYKTHWDQVLEQMVARGATGTDEEFDTIFTYLVAEFGRVAVNTAPADEIAEVLHLEEGVAQTIVQQRAKNGPFADFDALAAVPGVPVDELTKRRDAIVF
jgi:mono/diheme cytochrome c family protein